MTDYTNDFRNFAQRYEGLISIVTFKLKLSKQYLFANIWYYGRI